jgi:polar amino acid transport system ATP-binding protein
MTGSDVYAPIRMPGPLLEVADRVVFMADGRVIEQGPPEEVLMHPVHERTRAFLGKIL